MNLVTNLRAKQSQNAAPPAKARSRAKAEQELAEAPQYTPEHFSSVVLGCAAIGGNVEIRGQKPDVRRQRSEVGLGQRILPVRGSSEPRAGSSAVSEIRGQSRKTRLDRKCGGAK